MKSRIFEHQVRYTKAFHGNIFGLGKKSFIISFRSSSLKICESRKIQILNKTIPS